MFNTYMSCTMITTLYGYMQSRLRATERFQHLAHFGRPRVLLKVWFLTAISSCLRRVCARNFEMVLAREHISTVLCDMLSHLKESALLLLTHRSVLFNICTRRESTELIYQEYSNSVSQRRSNSQDSQGQTNAQTSLSAFDDRSLVGNGLSVQAKTGEVHIESVDSIFKKINAI